MLSAENEKFNRITIDPEFRDLLRPLNDDERKRLKAKIAREMVGNIVVWEETDILLDGHHNKAICDELDIGSFNIEYVGLTSREEAIEWIIENQLGRRNLTEAERAYYIGKEYLNKKKPDGDASRFVPVRHCDGLEKNTGETAKQVAEKHNVSPRTVERNAELAEAVDAETNGDPQARRELLGKSKKAAFKAIKRRRQGQQKATGPNPTDIPKRLQIYFDSVEQFEEARRLAERLANLFQIIEQTSAYKKIFDGKKQTVYSSTIRTAGYLLKRIVPKRPCPECGGEHEPSPDAEPCKVCADKSYQTAEEVGL
jgi:hypothetical protein